MMLPEGRRAWQNTNTCLVDITLFFGRGSRNGEGEDEELHVEGDGGACSCYKRLMLLPENPFSFIRKLRTEN